MVMDFRFPPRGFTVIELMVVMTVMAILVSIAAPRYIAHVDNARDTALRHNLKAIREAIDQFQADRGLAPKSLVELVQARYLKDVPEDPVTQRRDSWLFVSAEQSLATDAIAMGAAGRAAVRSGAPGTAKDGSRYAGW
jgi:general secretion pathway protein G